MLRSKVGKVLLCEVRLGVFVWLHFGFMCCMANDGLTNQSDPSDIV